MAVRGAVKDAIEQMGITDIQVAIAQCRTHATATAIALGNPVKKAAEGRD